MRAWWLWAVVAVVLVVGAGLGEARRGRGRAKSSRKGMGGRTSITRYKSEESKKYYNHEHGAKITVWSHFESEYLLGRKIVFICVAEGAPRPHITWYKDGIELYAHSFFQVHEWKHDERTIKSKMEIDPATQMDAGYYECQADNKYAVDVKGFRTDYLIVFD